MLSLKTTAKFRKDYKRMKKQGRDLHLLSAVIDDLLAEKTLDAKYHDHSLSGKPFENEGKRLFTCSYITLG